MALDSRVAFSERAKEVGLSQGQVDALAAKGVRTFAQYAYCTTYQPGHSDDKALLDFLADAFGAPLEAGEAASCRRLFFESHALSLEDLKSRVERSESSEARTLPLAEKMERLKQVKKKLAGISFTPQTEPSHSLIDKVCQQAEDNVVSYIDLTKCTSRHDESLQNRTDTSLALDSSGGLRVAKKLKTEDIPINGEHRLRLAFQRRAVAYEIANIASFSVLDHWTQRLLEKMNEPPVAGYRPVTMEQALNTDKAVWSRVSNETRNNLASTPPNPKPFDIAFEKFSNHPEVLFHLHPLPLTRADLGTHHPDPKGKNKDWKGDGNGDTKGKGKGKKGIAIPDNCSLYTQDNKQVCKRFQLGLCKAKIKPGKRCMLGYHLCWKTGCNKPHPGNECPL